MRISDSQIIIKRGTSFKAAFIFSDKEWEDLGTGFTVQSELKIGSVFVNLNPVINANSRSIHLSAATDTWSLGKGYFDIQITDENNNVFAIPEKRNFELDIIEGITR